MAKPGDALSRALGGRRRDPQAMATRERMRELERAAGGKTAAARRAGVTLRTWERWATGQHKPKPASLERLAAAQRRARVSERKERRIREGGLPGLTIKGTVRVSSDTRDRTVNLGDDLDPEMAERMLDAYLAGDSAELDAALADAVTEYVPGMEVIDVDSISFA